MTQNIECTECHDLLSLEGGRTITIPYICEKCSKQPALKPGFVLQTCKDETCSTCHPKKTTAYTASAEGEPEEDFATVENTTLLIQDLSDQLEQSQTEKTILIEKLAQAEDFIGAEVDRSTKFLEDLADLTQENAELRIDLEKSQTNGAKILKAFLEKIEL